MAAEFDIPGATYYAVAEAGYSYSSEQDTQYGARKYTTLPSAEAALPATASTPLAVNILGTWSAAQTSALSVSGTTTSATNFLRIRAIGAARHTGKWTSTAFRFDVAGNSSNGLTLSNQYTEAEGLQLKITFSSGSTQYGGFYSSGANSGFRACLAVGVVSGDSLGTKSGFRMLADQGNYSINCIAYDFIGATNSSVSGLQGGGMYNCTAYNCQFGIRRISGTVIAENCLAQSCTDGFNGAFSASSSNNCSDLTSDAPGSNPRTGTVAFVDAANRDLHLSASDTVALGYGVNLSGDPTFPFTVDIDDQTRGTTWDIGADQYISAGGGDATASPLGVSIVVGLGSVTLTATALALPLGVSLGSFSGSATPSGGANAAPSGVTATGSVGSTGASQDASGSPSGVSASVAVGSVVATGTASASPLGVAITAAFGTPSGRGNASVSPSGVALLAFLGIPVGIGSASASPLGVSLAAAIGSPIMQAGPQPPRTFFLGYAQRWTRL